MKIHNKKQILKLLIGSILIYWIIYVIKKKYEKKILKILKILKKIINNSNNI
jgi:uncharacterized membrane protein